MKSHGRPYLVGERGPELLTVKAAGYVTPNTGRAIVEAISAYGRRRRHPICPVCATRHPKHPT